LAREAARKLSEAIKDYKAGVRADARRLNRAEKESDYD